MDSEMRTFVRAFALLLATGSATIPGEASAQDAAGVASGWIVSSEPERTYGWVEDAPDSEFSAVVGAVYGSDGRIAVADRTLATITVLAADGSVMATMGRAGDGPGEFRALAGIAAAGEGRIVAFDGELQRLSEWTFDGSLSDDTRLSRAGATRGIGTVRLPDGLRVLDISAGALTGVRTDEFGRQFVQVHALERGGDLERRPLPPGCG